MSEVTVANKDALIIAAVKTALTNATVGGTKVFQDVAVTTSREQAAECSFTAAPIAVIRYVNSVDDSAPGDRRNGHVALELIIAARVHPAKDESTRLQEILRLKNAAVNAIETDPPSDASACGDGDYYHERIRWGEPTIDTSGSGPWAVCILPAEFGFTLSSATSH